MSDRRLISHTYNEYDRSREIDVERMQERSVDPNRSEKERKYANEALYRLKHQKDNPHIIRLREKMRIATQNGDKATVEKLSEESKKIDMDFRM